MTCKRSELVYDPPRRNITAKDEMEHYAIQRYYKHGDLLEYVHKKNGIVLFFNINIIIITIIITIF